VRAGRVRGEAYLTLGTLELAEDDLGGAVARARSCDLVEEAIPAMLALSECLQRRDAPDQARELIDGVWALAENGPYPLLLADAYNRLAELELALGRYPAATEAATKAHRLAWRDGPPFAHHWGLEHAKRTLAVLGASIPTYT
jgi:tetratricopeptide (TPR) repeat protein